MSKLNQHEIIPLPTDIGALANRINMSTRKEHDVVNKSVSLKFAVALRDGKIYRQGIQGFYHVFKTVEMLIQQELQSDSKSKIGGILSKFWDERVARTEPLTKDLLYFYNNDPKKFQHPIRKEQIEFVDHIIETYKEKPHILLAYCHVMYLALFAGGKIMNSKLAKATGLFPQVDGQTTEQVSKYGTNLYQFNIEDDQILRASYKRDYELATRHELTEQEKLDIIEESKEIYRRNADMIRGIEKHNREKITNKLSYKVVVYGYYIGILISTFALIFFVRRLINHLF
ncbi:Heme oxygenase 1 [Wickerhamomyces ciferrii]|uniref:Heme oxygenase 1 n=1 Tax=Wickerhamomyces ciferrii (strain ATCC 14091 / BCRC 22168 / CBS 111 / JCM 3599 / NBRC 0793 / NRRL Y-1031 F-60-10) TaxID=1206466 RepID=K0K904_WICCF|nr:Heme oxygenase 1 [Wickerhamomyces ciferrii]CCH41345.1 Heme oxygenase 1 [Wickerhamomyces ciferrii]